MARNKRRYPKKAGAKGPTPRPRGYYHPGKQPRPANPLKRPGATIHVDGGRAGASNPIARGAL